MIVSWFSCGAASAVATKLALEKYGSIRIVNNPVSAEHEDNRRFLKACERWFGQEIEMAINPCFPSCAPEDVWKEYGVMKMPRFAPCSRELKQYARRQWEADNNFNKSTDILIMGFTAGEEDRAIRFREKHPEYNLETPLIDAGYTKERCWEIVNSAGIAVPKIYRLGFDNANCLGCVYGGIGYWQKIKREFPEVFEARCKQSREIGCKLLTLETRRDGERVKTRLFLDELTDDMVGIEPKGFDCGIFCAAEDGGDE